MHLEVQLANPCGGVGIVGFGGREELCGRLDDDARQTLEIAHASVALHHVSGGTAAAVSETERCHRHIAAAVIGVVAFGMRELRWLHRHVVGIDRREVGEDARAIDALPPKRVVGHAVLLVPAELLSQKPLGSAQCKNLRQAGWVAEHIGDPDLFTGGAVVLFEEPLTVQELARQ